MGSRRFRPLILCVLGLTALVLARLFQLQVLEHEVWAREAVNLVRSSAVIPYRRGSIVDRLGRPLVTDEDVYRVEFRYRDFRRGHPLGQVAHAWSSLELRPVPLDEARSQLVPAGLELAQLTHAQLDAFAEGAALETGTLSVGAAAPGRAEYRLSRRADLRFYVSRLLQLDRREALNAVRSKEEFPSMLAYALSRRPELGGDREALLDELALRLQASLDDLQRLADELHGGDLGALVARLEGWRREVEDSTASELFREAAGFSLGRVAPQAVGAWFDLDWVAVLLRWDQARLDEWIVGAREQWIDAFDEYHRKRLAVLSELAGSREPERPEAVAGIVSGFWAERFLADPSAHGEPRRGRSARHPLQVFDQLDSLFRTPVPRDRRAADLRVLPFEEPGVRYGPGAGWEDVARLELWALAGAGPVAAPTDEAVAERAQLWREHNLRGPDKLWIDERTLEVVSHLELRFQEVLAEHLTELAAHAGSARLALSEGRLDRAEERAQSVLKDRGSRPFDVDRDRSAGRLAAAARAADAAVDPGYRLIHLLTRYPEAFAGFGVREATRRQLEAYPRGQRAVPYAAALLGNVRAPGLRDLLEQRTREQQLNALERSGERNEEAIAELVRDLLLVDEQLGGDGIEGHFEEELSGTNGYRARRGMQELLGSGEDREYYQPPEDGRRLVLTIDRDLQAAAQETLAHPAEDPEPHHRDYRWLNRPTGAIVLITVEGDVLAAASYPDHDRSDPATGAPSSDKRDWAIDRTLTAVGFQPPGSVFKPFVAAWALDRAGLDPADTMVCGPRAEGPGAGYKTLGCHGHHHEIGLHGALMRSCNGYFAWLGEQLDEPQFHQLADCFGFGQHTGVRVFPARGGLHEATCERRLLEGLNPTRLRMAANGLGVISATPMQVARAYAGLATGSLPELRLVDRVGDEVLPHRSRPVGLSEPALEIVRSALYDVANQGGGSAYEALRASEIGFYMCAKTGSADIDDQLEEAPDGELRVRKHTWVAGWFPPKNPLAVVVIFVDDTIMTSSKTAVWIARQFLLQKAVQDFVRRELDG